MYKKLIPTILIALLLFPTFASAFTIYENTNPAKWTNPVYNAERNRYVSNFDEAFVDRIELTSYHDSAFTEVGTFKDITVPDSAQDFVFGCNTYYHLKAFNSSGTLQASLKFHATEIINPDATACFSELNDPGTPPPAEGEGCIGCDLFNCPGWTDYMGKLDEIKAAIPPPPNWPVVADIFRDSIAPRIKQDMADLIGVSPTPSIPQAPPMPDMPTPPAQPSGLDNRGITAPTGNEAPGLEDSTFSADDLKQSAPTIQERSDPTGGFKITDPISGLPSQEEFEQNAPIEGEAPFPGDPTEQENPSPTPIEQENTAPTPTEQENPSPTPGEDYGTAPIPGDTGDTAPIPGSDSGTAPIPGDTGGTAPTPGEGGGFTAPYP